MRGGIDTFSVTTLDITANDETILCGNGTPPHIGDTLHLHTALNENFIITNRVQGDSVSEVKRQAP